MEQYVIASQCGATDYVCQAASVADFADLDINDVLKDAKDEQDFRF